MEHSAFLSRLCPPRQVQFLLQTGTRIVHIIALAWLVEHFNNLFTIVAVYMCQ